MNIAPYPTDNSNSAISKGRDITDSTPNALVGPEPTPGERRSGKSWIFSLTLVCFLFGGALALQLRAMNQVRVNEQRKVQGVIQAQAQVQDMQRQSAKEKAEKQRLQSRLAQLQNAVATGTVDSKKKADELNARITELQLVAGLTPVSGPGVKVTLADSPNAAKGGDPNIMPGLVHDFDVLQVVNELRAAKAEAIAINGTRITSYTPIRCVGPTILINWEPKPAPFHIEAVGDPDGLRSALLLPGGILDKLKNEATLSVHVERTRNLRLAAAESVPHLRVAKSNAR